MKALILAAGYGTRLYPYTRFLPKPLLKVNKRPIIEYLIDKLAELEDLSEILVVTNGLFFKRFQSWRATVPFKKKVRIVNDMTKSPEDRLGAVGDMDFVFRKEGFTEDYLVMGGDNFFKAPLTDFVRAGKKNAPAATVGIYDIKEKEEASHYGVVITGRDGRIVKFAEKPVHPESSLIAMCLYYLPVEKAGLIQKYFKTPHSKDAIGVFIDWLTKQDTVFGFTFRDFWIDIGRIQTYRKLKCLFEKAQSSKAGHAARQESPALSRPAGL